MADTALFVITLIGVLCVGAAFAQPGRRHRRHRRRVLRVMRHG